MSSLRQYVFERAGFCCEHCLIHQQRKPVSFHLEHIISAKHGGKTQEDNLCMSCPRCNYYKGSDIASIDPLTGNATFLYNPRKQSWFNHFQLNGAIIEPLIPEGRVTLFLLRLNAFERVRERSILLRFNLYPYEKPL